MITIKNKIDILFHEIDMKIKQNKMQIAELNGKTEGLVVTRDALEKIIADEERSTMTPEND